MTAAILGLLLVALSEDSRWPGFLGVDAATVDPQSIPTEWSPTENLAWQQKLPGYGQSSPVVWKDHVYVTTVVGKVKEKCVVTCLQLKDGETVWQVEVESSDKVESNLYISRAAPTPVVDDQGIFVFFETGDTVAISHSGEKLWQRSLTKEYGPFENRFGLSASPLQSKDAIYILADHEGPSYLVKLRKSNGETIWKTERDSRVSWSSPSWTTIDGTRYIVVSSAGSVDGYDESTGEQVWSFDDVNGNTANTPLPFGDGQFLVGASPGRQSENQAAAERSNMAMKVEMKDDVLTPTVMWRAERTTSSFGSPIVYRGNAYWVNRTGVVFCFDAETGKRKFNGRLAESNWATPVGVGDRIYFFGQKGSTTVIAAGDKFQKLAENRLWEVEPADPDAQPGRGNFGGRTQYGVAIVDGSLLVRTGDILYCIRD